jgi:hypothetical protein
MSVFHIMPHKQVPAAFDEQGYREAQAREEAIAEGVHDYAAEESDEPFSVYPFRQNAPKHRS